MCAPHAGLNMKMSVYHNDDDHCVAHTHTISTLIRKPREKTTELATIEVVVVVAVVDAAIIGIV